MHSTSFAKKNNIDNQFQVFLEGMREIESLVTQDRALIPFALALVNNVKGKIFDRQAKAQARLLHPLSQPQFEPGECDNNIRRHPNFLERSKSKVGNVGKKRKIGTSN